MTSPANYKIQSYVPYHSVSITTGTFSQLHHRFSYNILLPLLSCRHCWNISDITNTISIWKVVLYNNAMLLWASACSNWQWMVRHITLSFVIGSWCHLRKRWSGGFFGRTKNRIKKNIYTKYIYIWKSWRIGDVYTNIFQEKSTCICISGDL